MSKGKRSGRSSKKDIKTRSNFEEKIKNDLEERKIKFEYETKTIKYTIPESKHSYKPDFIIGNLIVEAKGIFDAPTRKKMALVIQQHPELDIRMLFMRNQQIRKGSNTDYGQWCDKNGITWAEGASIPQDWVDSARAIVD